MIETNIREIDVDALQEQVRAEAGRLAVTATPVAAVRQLISAPGRLFGKHRRAASAERPYYRLGDFLIYHDSDFIHQAYWGLLGREPYPEDQSKHLKDLRSGAKTRLEMLGNLRYSPEGRQYGAQVQGLRVRHLANKAFQVPLLGYGFSLASALLRLPRILRLLNLIETTNFSHLSDLRHQIDRELSHLREDLNRQVERFDSLEDAIEPQRAQLDRWREQESAVPDKSVQGPHGGVDGSPAAFRDKADHLGAEVTKRMEETREELLRQIDQFRSEVSQRMEEAMTKSGAASKEKMPASGGGRRARRGSKGDDV